MNKDHIRPKPQSQQVPRDTRRVSEASFAWETFVISSQLDLSLESLTESGRQK